jgi:hypothetical protein
MAIYPIIDGMPLRILRERKGVDYQSGYGLINCFRAVKEVLRRKAIREGKDPKPYKGRIPGDEIDTSDIGETLDQPVLQ